MSQAEPGWEKHPYMPNASTRPLIGMELWMDQNARLNDGTGQFTIGIQFNSSTCEYDIEARLKEAIVRLRFECPLVAATIEQGLHHPEFRSWVYAPLPDVDAARTWAANTVHYIPNLVQDPASFLQSTVDNNEIPYILADKSEQFLRVYLTRPSTTLNGYFLAVHASHSIIDARPGLNVLSLLLEWITTPDLASVDELAWGTEHKNLPPGPITATGGPREDWSTNGMALVAKYFGDPASRIPSHGLLCDVSRISRPWKAHRLHVRFTVEESASIARALKTLGFSFSELVDAAAAVAVFEQNAVPADKLDSACVSGGSPIAITDRLPPSVDRRRHVVSCLVPVPYRIAYAPLAPLAGQARLLAAMRERKAQYAWWLANPCLPHLLAELAPRIVPTAAHTPAPGASAHMPAVTNIGRVENYVAAIWPRRADVGVRMGAAVVIRVDEMHLACRMGSGMFMPLVHAWSLQGRLSVLIQAAEVWDKDALQEFMNRIVRQICLVME